MSNAKCAMTKNLLKIIVSIAVSVIAGYLAFRNVQLKQVMSVIRQVNVMSIVFVVILLVVPQFLRSFRWGLLLSPLEEFSQRLLLPITFIGFLFVWILPARLGEVTRPYLLQQNSRVGLSAAMGSIVLERLIDASFLVALLAICLPALQLPAWLLSSFQGFIILLLFAVVVVLLGSLPQFRRWFLRLAARILPERLSDFLTQAAENFYQGMQAVVKIKTLLATLAQTLMIWAGGLAAFMVMFHAMDLQLGLLAGITVLVLTCLGIALPAGPGFIGNYHYACMVALTLFGVGKDTALAYAVLIHFINLVVLVAMGVLSINVSKLKVGFSLKSAIRSEQ
jgi:uncharacterized protein (TIRG00374 family)